MSAVQHTPGPWRAVRGDDMVFVEAVNIAHVGVAGGNAYEAPFVVQAKPGSEASVAHNALLIAAAPELLSALIDAEELLSGAGYSTGEHRAAIAKATGAA